MNEQEIWRIKVACCYGLMDLFRSINQGWAAEQIACGLRSRKIHPILKGRQTSDRIITVLDDLGVYDRDTRDEIRKAFDIE